MVFERIRSSRFIQREMEIFVQLERRNEGGNIFGRDVCTCNYTLCPDAYTSSVNKILFSSRYMYPLASFEIFNVLFDRLRWQLIADHNERPSRITIIRRFLFLELVGMMPREAINLSFALPIFFHLDILNTEKNIPISKQKKSTTCVSFQRKRLMIDQRIWKILSCYRRVNFVSSSSYL